MKRTAWNAIVNFSELTPERITVKGDGNDFPVNSTRYGIPVLGPSQPFLTCTARRVNGWKAEKGITFRLNTGTTELLQMPLSYSATFITTLRTRVVTYFCCCIPWFKWLGSDRNCLYGSGTSPTEFFIKYVLFINSKSRIKVCKLMICRASVQRISW